MRNIEAALKMRNKCCEGCVYWRNLTDCRRDNCDKVCHYMLTTGKCREWADDGTCLTRAEDAPKERDFMGELFRYIGGGHEAKRSHKRK